MFRIIFIFSILIFAQNSFGQFFEHPVFDRRGPFRSCVADIDQDGLKDVLSTFSDGIEVNINLGNGQFSEQQIIIDNLIFAVNVPSIVAVDMDGDGDNDIVTGEGTVVRWRENLGNLQFGLPISLTSLYYSINDVLAEDMDGDGDIDIAAAQSGSGIKIFTNSGQNNFVLNTNSSLGANSATSMYCADLNGDGDKDIIATVYNSGTSEIKWFENTPYTFLSFNDAGVTISTSALGPQDVFASDLDGDGDKDVLVASSIDNKISWLENLGNGQFSTLNIISTTDMGARTVTAIDMDGDGDNDVISSSYTDNKITLYKNLGAQVFSAPITILTLPQTDEKEVFVGDMDGDSDNDVLFGTCWENKIAWCENLGSDLFSNQHIIYSAASYPTALVTDDVDADGIIDVVFAAKNDVGWYKNEGNGNFYEQKINRISEEGGTAIVSIDLDGDGDKDVLVAAETLNKIVWYENLGSNNYSTQKIISTQVNGIKSIASADLDNDGDNDIVSGSELDNKIAWFENLGNGVFSTQKIISSGLLSHVKSILITDINNDGFKDIVSASQYDDKIGWYKNLGNKTFSTQKIISTLADGPTFVHAADLDGDGDKDIIAIASLDHNIVWCENLGNELFGMKRVITAAPYSSSSTYTNDMDGDGDLDVISLEMSKLAWYENLGNYQFGAQQILSTTSSLTSVSGGDMDNDSDIDILFSTNYKISWFENNSINNKIVKGKLFIDVNQNGILDGQEVGMNQVNVHSTPINNYTFTYPNGDYFISYHDTITCVIQPDVPENWKITSDSINYHIHVDSNFFIRENLDFGFYPDTLVDSITHQLVGAFPRCNTIVNYWINIKNSGSTLSAGLVHLELDSSISYIGSNLTTDSIAGNNIYWKYDSLMYFSDKQIQVQVQLPDFQSAGDTLIDFLTISTYDSTGTITKIYTDSLKQKLVCAYDPNDKNVMPQGLEQAGYILDDTEWLEYTIRFQNTGTDTAVNVVIKDSLSNLFDWSTLVPLANSHSVAIDVDQMGIATFAFMSIMLPDSSTNDLLNHGFIRFKIKLLDNLSIGSVIVNTADIYFDENPAIITNSTKNTLYNCTDPFPLANYSTNYCLGQHVMISATEVYQSSTILWNIDDEVNQSGNDFDWAADSAGMYNLHISIVNSLCSKDTTLQLSVSPIYELMDTVTLCDGDSLSIFGVYRIMEATYYDTLQSTHGCDSIVGIRLEFFDPIVVNIDTTTICSGDSLLLYGVYRNTPGMYYDTLQSINGCDSIIGTNLDLYTLPIVTLSEFSQSSTCSNSAFIPLPTAFPANGVYMGSGLNDTYFDPSTALIDENKLVYTFTDTNGCSNSDSTFITVFETKQTILDTLYICSGDSILIFDIEQTEGGLYSDSLQTINGCDSVIVIQLVVYPSIAETIIDSLTTCEPLGVSIFGVEHFVTGNYYDTLQSINGCDSIVGIYLEVYPVSNVNLSNFSQDTICSNAGLIELPTGIPLGGLYSGNGIVVDQFDPSSVNVGENYIFYAYTDTNNCVNTDSSSITILDCLGITEFVNPVVSIYPNPFNDYVTISVQDNKYSEILITDVSGKLVLNQRFTDSTIKIDMSRFSGGQYILTVKNDSSVITRKIVK